MMHHPRRWRAAGAAAAVAVLANVPAAAPGPASAAPVVTSTTNDVTALAAAPGSHDAWAVGNTFGTGAPRGFVWTSSGGAWSVARGVPSIAGSTFFSVKALTPRDVWVGGAVYGATGVSSFFLQWNGVSWRRVPVLLPSALAGYGLTAAAVVSPSDIWVIVDGSCSASGCRSVLVRFDGHRWSQMNPPGLGTAAPIAVGATSPTDVWVTAGSCPVTKPTCTSAFALAYTGNWRKMTLPVPLTGFSPLAVAGPKDVWVAGTGVAHYTGSRWVKERGTPAGSTTVTLAPFGTGAAWGAAYARAGSTDRWSLLRYNEGAGSAMTVALPPKSPSIGQVAAASAANAWLVGTSWTGKVCRSSSFPYALHWNGKRWARIGVPAPAGAALARSLAGPEC